MAINWQRYGKIGIGVGITAWLMGLFWGYVVGGGQAQSTIDFGLITEGVKARIASGVDATIAEQIIGYLNGLIPFDLMGLVMLALSGAVIVIVGAFVLQFLPVAGLKRTSFSRLVSMTVLGTIVVGLILSFIAGESLALPTFNAVVTMVIYFAIVAVVYGFLARLKISKKIFLEA